VIENGKETQGGRWNPMQKLNSRPNIRNIRYGEQMVLILPSVLWVERRINFCPLDMTLPS
jgi:hypothetical protein